MPDRIEEAKRYNRIKVRLKLVDILFVFLYLSAFQFFVSPHLKTFACSLTPNFYYAFTIYLICFSLANCALNFPLHLYSGFILEHKFNLSNQRFFAWIIDDLKKGVISFFIFLVFIHALYIFLDRFEGSWWIWIAVFWFVVTILIARITPTLLIPLFYKYSPVEEHLKESIIRLSEKCKIKVLDVFKIDFSKKTNKLNAAVTGMGKTRRVLLADNLIREFTVEEVGGVLAHEFAHHKMFHIWKMLAFGAVTTFASFYALFLLASQIVRFFNASGIHDMQVFPSFLLVLFLAGLVAMPLQNGFSRKLEKDADSFALKVTGDKNTFISLMRKLAEKNLSDPNPPKIIKFLFYDHPPISERISSARNYRP